MTQADPGGSGPGPGPGPGSGPGLGLGGAGEGFFHFFTEEQNHRSVFLYLRARDEKGVSVVRT